MNRGRHAKTLARLLRQYPLWSIRRDGNGGFVAERITGERLEADSLAELERLLRARHRDTGKPPPP